MVGAAVAEATGVVPEGWVAAGLQVPQQLLFPLAPAQGLLLVSQGFTAGKSGACFGCNDSRSTLESISHCLRSSDSAVRWFTCRSL
jgi:hypothetical protein